MKMGSTVTVRPGEVKGESARKRQTRTADTSQSEMPEISMQENISKLAYALWERNDCPEGSAECDWQEAERQLCKTNATSFADR
jgi:hypothetical protein